MSSTHLISPHRVVEVELHRRKPIRLLLSVVRINNRILIISTHIAWETMSGETMSCKVLFLVVLHQLIFNILRESKPILLVHCGGAFHDIRRLFFAFEIQVQQLILKAAVLEKIIVIQLHLLLVILVIFDSLQVIILNCGVCQELILMGGSNTGRLFFVIGVEVQELILKVTL
ncbi:hypothetical protein GLYMA_18G067101v4 [Glycine max]|nr:hypothetical protein GLYMA_18G067101v4 [Glycine max]KAH1153541.1 hypothetical protein GYH30_049251 [Glycine max]